MQLGNLLENLPERIGPVPTNVLLPVVVLAVLVGTYFILFSGPTQLKYVITVTDPNGNPIEGATVELDGEIFETNADGIAVFIKEEPAETIHVSAPYFEDYSGPVTDTEMHITLKPEVYDIKITVYDSAKGVGSLVEGSKIVVKNSEEETWKFDGPIATFTASAAKGVADVYAPGGQLSINVYAQGYKPAKNKILRIKKGVLMIGLAKEVQDQTATVRIVTSEPVDGKVLLISNGVPIYEAYVKKGVAEIKGVKPGAYEAKVIIYVNGNPYDSPENASPIVVQPGKNTYTVNVELPPARAGPATIIVKDANTGEPIPAPYARLSTGTVVRGKDGKITVHAKPEGTKVVVGAKKYKEVNVTVKPGETKEVALERLPATGDLIVKVVDASTLPLPDAVVQLLKDGAPVGEPVPVDGTGVAKFEDILVGDYTVQACSGSVCEEKNVTIEEDKTTKVTILISGGKATLHIFVTLDGTPTSADVYVYAPGDILVNQVSVDISGEAEVEVPAFATLYVKAVKGDIIAYTPTFKLTPDEEKEINITFESKAQPGIEFVGIYNVAGENTDIIEPGKVYRAIFKYVCSGDCSYTFKLAPEGNVYPAAIVGADWPGTWVIKDDSGNLTEKGVQLDASMPCSGICIGQFAVEITPFLFPVGTRVHLDYDDKSVEFLIGREGICEGDFCLTVYFPGVSTPKEKRSYEFRAYFYYRGKDELTNVVIHLDFEGDLQLTDSEEGTVSGTDIYIESLQPLSGFSFSGTMKVDSAGSYPLAAKISANGMEIGEAQADLFFIPEAGKPFIILPEPGFIIDACDNDWNVAIQVCDQLLFQEEGNCWVPPDTTVKVYATDGSNDYLVANAEYRDGKYWAILNLARLRTLLGTTDFSVYITADAFDYAATNKDLQYIHTSDAIVSDDSLEIEVTEDVPYQKYSLSITNNLPVDAGFMYNITNLDCPELNINTGGTLALKAGQSGEIPIDVELDTGLNYKCAEDEGVQLEGNLIVVPNIPHNACVINKSIPATVYEYVNCIEAKIGGGGTHISVTLTNKCNVPIKVTVSVDGEPFGSEEQTVLVKSLSTESVSFDAPCDQYIKDKATVEVSWTNPGGEEGYASKSIDTICFPSSCIQLEFPNPITISPESNSWKIDSITAQVSQDCGGYSLSYCDGYAQYGTAEFTLHVQPNSATLYATNAPSCKYFQVFDDTENKDLNFQLTCHLDGPSIVQASMQKTLSIQPEKTFRDLIEVKNGFLENNTAYEFETNYGQHLLPHSRSDISPLLSNNGNPVCCDTKLNPIRIFCGNTNIKTIPLKGALLVKKLDLKSFYKEFNFLIPPVGIIDNSSQAKFVPTKGLDGTQAYDFPDPNSGWSLALLAVPKNDGFQPTTGNLKKIQKLTYIWPNGSTYSPNGWKDPSKDANAHCVTPYCCDKLLCDWNTFLLHLLWISYEKSDTDFWDSTIKGKTLSAYLVPVTPTDYGLEKDAITVEDTSGNQYTTKVTNNGGKLYCCVNKDLNKLYTCGTSVTCTTAPTDKRLNVYQVNLYDRPTYIYIEQNLFDTLKNYLKNTNDRNILKLQLKVLKDSSGNVLVLSKNATYNKESQTAKLGKDDTKLLSLPGDLNKTFYYDLVAALANRTEIPDIAKVFPADVVVVPGKGGASVGPISSGGNSGHCGMNPNECSGDTATNCVTSWSFNTLDTLNVEKFYDAIYQCQEYNYYLLITNETYSNMQELNCLFTYQPSEICSGTTNNGGLTPGVTTGAPHGYTPT